MNKDQRSNELWVHLVDRLRRGLWRDKIEMSYQPVESLNQSQPHCGLTKTSISPSLLLTVYPPTCRGYSWYCSRRTGYPGTGCQTRVRTTAVNWGRNKVQSGSSPNLVTRPQPSYFWFMHGWGLGGGAGNKANYHQCKWSGNETCIVTHSPIPSVATVSSCEAVSRAVLPPTIAAGHSTHDRHGTSHPTPGRATDSARGTVIVAATRVDTNANSRQVWAALACVWDQII